MIKMISLTLALFAALAPAAAGAAPRPIELPAVEERMMDNGLRVFIVKTEEVPLVTIRLLIPAGAAVDPPGLRGLADLTATMIMRGADGLDAESIAEMIEGAGGSLESSASLDMTQVYGDFMSRDLELGLDMLSRTVMSPDFPEDEFEREKGIVKAGLMSQKENPFGVATKVFMEELFGGHPYGGPTEGYLDTVEKITRGDVAEFHRANYVPEGCLLAVVGDVDPDRAMKLIERKLGRWKGRREEGRSVAGPGKKAVKGRRVVVIDKPDVTQSQIRIGNIGVAMDTPDYFALEVANTILGGGFTSRLMEEIRVNRGLSYGARSTMSKYRSGGLFLAYTYTKNSTLRECIDVALEEIGRLGDEEVGEEELEGAERYISGLFPFELETNSDLARWLMNVAFYGLDEDFVEKYRGRIDGVKAEEVQRAAREHFLTSGNLIVVLTNYEETAGQLEGLGDIEVISIDDVR